MCTEISSQQRHSKLYSGSPSKEYTILTEVVHSEEEEERLGRRTETPLGCVGRAVWKMLYADDAGFVSRSPEDCCN